MIIVAPYYVYSLIRYGEAFVDGHFGWTLKHRLTEGYGDTVGMAGGRVAYLEHLWAADGPLVVAWMLLGVVLGVRAWKRGNVLVGCALTTALTILLVFSLSATRLPHYILMVYPAMAIALGGAYAELVPSLQALREPLRNLLLGTFLISVLFVGLSRETPSSYLLPSPAAVAVGKAVAASESELPLYTLDWYAPAAAYYGHRPWLALFGSEALASSLSRETRFFHLAQNINAAPPWPQPPFLLAGPKAAIAQTGLSVARVLLDLEGVIVLVEVGAP